MKVMKESTKYKILTAIRYFGDGFFYPFFSLYLQKIGLVESRIGFILSITPILAIITNPIYSKICTNMKITKKVLGIITVLEAIVIIAVGFSTNFYLVSALAVLLAVFGSCHYGLMDSLTSIYASEKGITYSSIRVFGSISYIVATSVGGIIIDNIDYNVCFIISGAMFIISGLMYALIKPLDNDKEQEKTKGSYKEIFKNKALMIFILFYILLEATSFSADHFLALYLESRGLSEKNYGFVYSYFVLIEVIMLLVLNKFFKKTSSEKLLLIATIAFIIRMAVNYLALPLSLTIVVCGLRGVTYGLLLHTTYTYIIKIAGKKNATISIMFMTMLKCAYMGLGDNIFGTIIEKFSYKTFYFVVLIIGVLALVLALYRLINYSKNKQENNANLEEM